MAENPLLLDALVAFARTMAGHYEISDVLHELASSAVDVLEASGAGVSLIDPAGRLQFATASTDAVSRLERVQEEQGEGPCWQAHHTGTPVVVSDVRESEEWPQYRQVCAEVDLRAVVGIPMWWNGVPFGALNVYRAEAGAWTDEEVSSATVLADMATSLVAHASQLHEARRLNEQLQEALDSRVVIEQAKGLIAGERDVTLNEAFDLLRRHARSNHASLRAVASAVVELGFRP